MRTSHVRSPQNPHADPLSVKYIWNKGSIVGPAWKIPFIGPFLESMNPKMDKYIEKFNSGELSCVSVFHKCVLLISHYVPGLTCTSLQVRGYCFVSGHGAQSLQFAYVCQALRG